jgi:hypothetical protein
MPSDVIDAQDGIDRGDSPTPNSGVKRQSTTRTAEALGMPAALPQLERPVALGAGRGAAEASRARLVSFKETVLLGTAAELHQKLDDHASSVPASIVESTGYHPDAAADPRAIPPDIC